MWPFEGIEPRTLVAPGIYRSGQPTDAELKLFRESLSGYTVLSLIDNTATEWPLVQSLGMEWENFPMPGFLQPKDSDVDSAVELLYDPLTHPILVHCQHGCDRTGLVVACYRIKYDGWTARAAQDEANQHHMSWISQPMRDYIEDYEKRISGKHK